MAWFNHSVEQQTGLQVCLTLTLFSLLSALCVSRWPYWWLALLLLVSMVILSRWLWRSRRLQLSAFRRASIQLDAIQQQDYSLYAKSAYDAGCAAEFQVQLQLLAHQLQQRKSFFDEQQFLLYRLIDQLNTPILVLNHKQQLSYANNDFQQLFGQPWQSLRLCSAASLSLEQAPDWQFVDPSRRQQWQIRHSRFFEQGDRYQLLVFIDIQQALRENQRHAWQQLIRVLSHEIRNSLTPVQSLAEFVHAKLPSSRERDALAVIQERSQHLQAFVERYAQLSQPLSVNWQSIELPSLGHSLQRLFPDAQLQLNLPPVNLVTDPTLLQQLLINLLKNAIEAESPVGTMMLAAELAPAGVRLQLLDQGHGLHNTTDVFVPFYTTKANGQGIGLSLCRQIADCLGAQLTLHNRTDGVQGCSAVLVLPWHQTSSSIPE
jgi:nitrogen fixation/metabolism regulation signal transduction histidine kinase